MAEPHRVGPGFAPIFGPDSRVLILGSFPSPKSREQGFYYGHPQNRFWPVLAALTGSPAPRREDIEAKRRLIMENGFALWDTIRCCTITGASDASVRDAEPNDLAVLLRQCPVERIVCNGAQSFRLYEKYAAPRTGMHAVQLPSTSPANAAWSLERLVQAWQGGLQMPQNEKHLRQPVAQRKNLHYNENNL